MYIWFSNRILLTGWVLARLGYSISNHLYGQSLLRPIFKATQVCCMYSGCAVFSVISTHQSRHVAINTHARACTYTHTLHMHSAGLCVLQLLLLRMCELVSE